MAFRAVFLAAILITAAFSQICAQSDLKCRLIPPQPADPSYFQRGFLDAGVQLQIAPLDAPTQQLVDGLESIRDAGAKGISAAGWTLSESSPFLIVVEFRSAGRTRDDADVLKITVTATEIAGGGKDQDDLWYPLLSVKTITLGRTGDGILETTVENMAHSVATSLLRECLKKTSRNRSYEFRLVEDNDRLD